MHVSFQSNCSIQITVLWHHILVILVNDIDICIADIVDGAILRPGRLDKILFVDFPNTKEKEDILCKITNNGKRPHLSDDFSYSSIAADPALEWFTYVSKIIDSRCCYIVRNFPVVVFLPDDIMRSEIPFII